MLSQNKRLVIASLIAGIIAIVFWTQSRVPALNEKAQMGLRTNFGEIAFEILLPVSSDQVFIERVIKSSVNWAYTNLIGMTFGLLFAAAILTILSNLKSRSFKRPWLNTLSGALIGSPLGVCVNCATPIAFGIYSAGARLETALASLFASPTLNAIVLTMTFTLLPWEIAIMKLVGVILLLCSTPILVKFFANSVDSTNNLPKPRNKLALEIASCSVTPSSENNESYLDALTVTTKSFFKHLFYIVKFALPLMLLAGFLGAFIIELIPFNIFTETSFNLFALISCAIVATLLPVPIAFDVIVVMALVSNGLDKGLATALLFALGIFSIYPAFLIARYISIKLSVAIAVAVILISCLLGYIANSYFDHKLDKEHTELLQGLSATNDEIYKNAIHVCKILPKQLHEICFEQHIEQFSKIVSYDAMCKIELDGLNTDSCKSIVDRFLVKQKALLHDKPELCRDIANEQSRFRCIYDVAVNVAIKNYDVDICNSLSNPEAITSCREKYLNKNLLFNPDGSACNKTKDEELYYCQVNAEIYMLTDAINIDGCDRFENDGAKEHCRYTVASAMIGKHNDSSGCLKIQSPELRSRCQNQVVGWDAFYQNSFELCTKVENDELKYICLLRIADKRIKTILVDHSLASYNVEKNLKANKENSTISPATKLAPQLNWTDIHTEENIIISYSPYREINSNNINKFKKLNASELGIDKFWNFRMTDFFEPFIIGKGIASGDYNNDSWPDIMLATENGVALYKNIGGEFELVSINQKDMQKANLFLVTFVDANNDGFQDIFSSSYSGTNFLLLNLDGEFNKTSLINLEGKHRLTMAAGFGDLNEDGELDIVLGNWSSGVENLFSTVESENTVMIREGDSYRIEKQDIIKGETNSVLIADINNDNFSDVLIGNDRLIPDTYYLNNGQGQLNPISNEDGFVPVTSMFTMSIDAADFNNDLKTDLFSTDMTFSRSDNESYCSAIQIPDIKNYCKKMLGYYDFFQQGNAFNCKNLDITFDQQQCYIAFSIKAAKDLKNIKYCESIADKNSAAFSLCQYLATPVEAEETVNQEQFIPQTQNNVLLINDDRSFIESSNNYGVASSYWSWNAKAADLDNDGWQDIYVGNGFHFGDSFYEIQENILFHNIGGKYFEQRQADWGLNDTINTPSYTYLDLDLDGDLDIIATGVLTPPRVYINQLKQKNSITFILNDDISNFYGIGAKITIHYGGNKQLSQRKENLLSGGFMSYNNPVIHFGLGQHTKIDAFEVTWPDGNTTTYNKQLSTTGIYRINRTSY